MSSPDNSVEFKSRFSLGDSIERVRRRVRTEPFASASDKPALGVVGEDKTRIYWYTGTSFVNSFKPIFEGRFAQVNGDVILRGSFIRSGAGKMQSGTVFLFIALSLLPLSLIVMGDLAFHRLSIWEIFVPLIIVILLVCFAIFRQRRWRQEVELLTKLLSEALQDDGK